MKAAVENPNTYWSTALLSPNTKPIVVNQVKLEPIIATAAVYNAGITLDAINTSNAISITALNTLTFE